MTFIKSTVYDGATNNNGFIDPGETADLTVTLKNIGGLDFTDLSTTLLCSSAYITINDNSGYFGSLAIDSTKENTADRYTVTASGTTPYNTEVDFLLITEEGGFHDTLDFTLIIGLSAPTDTGYYYAYFSGGLHPQAPNFAWIAIDSTQTTYPGTSLDLDDNEIVQLALPFNFQYYGVTYDTVTVSSNGWIAMGYRTEIDPSNTGIPSTDGPSAMIAAMWDDMDPGNAGQPGDVYYYYEEANHIFIIEYFQVEHWPVGGTYETFEIILYDPAYNWTPTNDGEIIVQYLTTYQESDITVGIENASETIGIEYFLNGTYDPLAGAITDEFAIKYTTIPPGGAVEKSEYSSDGVSTKYSIYPVISCGLPYNIRYAFDKNTPFQIKIYNATGRLVDEHNFGMRNGSGLLSFHLHDHAQGIYFVTCIAGNDISTNKIIWLR